MVLFVKGMRAFDYGAILSYPYPSIIIMNWLTEKKPTYPFSRFTGYAVADIPAARHLRGAAQAGATVLRGVRWPR